ncbi:hypothetical protein FS837_011744 [Tulasnella sp. UAMH 9824]|nr:hypothetical protein FS837_011744 [Tulasnella sp. UAMH 9824]
MRGAKAAAAAKRQTARQKSKPPGFTESLYTRRSFQAEFESVALKGAALLQLDVDVVLKYLERDARVVIVQKNVCVCLELSLAYLSLRFSVTHAVKFVEPEDAEAIAEGITEVDFGVLEMKTTLQKLVDQISEIEHWGASAARTQEHCAYVPSVEEQLEELLAKRLNTQETLQTVLYKIESAATEVEIMKGYDTSARTLRAVLPNPLLQKESIDATMERMADVLGDHKEIEDAISLGNDLAASSAGVPDVDDDELKDELGMLIEEQKKKEEEEKERLRLEEKHKAEEKERARVEAEKKRKARRTRRR